ncbi:hypothetical protein [Rubinisphaera margarita]|uniref:hypothetical protein n=1 Tax=Rubinisphaera margarita TaxID=2909586 RepID=UPI001EE88530|nr:hypothetical protein [Rubinisphaera margarita]MCG6154596.1 hypothetical protein [Rubinisphaera margarita]
MSLAFLFIRSRCLPFIALVGLLSVLFLGATSTAQAQIEFDREPISYSDATPRDPVAKLQERLKQGNIALKFDDEQGYLKSVLEELKIPASSQVLVYSKTSFQLRKITPERPRALYFNDDVYVGWVQDGDVLEVMSMDPELGAVFYVLHQDQLEMPRFIRDQGQCLTCHASSRTQGVPGGLVRSAFVAGDGQPHFGAGTFTIDHRSPFDQRWGGYYVSGSHGQMRHMGNAISPSRQEPEAIDREAGANVTDLSTLVDLDPYLAPHSDLVALMVLEHQTQMQNMFTLVSMESRLARHHDGIMNEALGRENDYVSDSTGRRIASAGDKLLEYMLFKDEFALTSPVSGSSEFTREFQQQGPRDSQGRSLRDFDLKTRMFKYPCSYLVDSAGFKSLPTPAKQYVVTRLHRILTGQDTSEEFAYLSATDRQAILEILTETQPKLWDDVVNEAVEEEQGTVAE